MADNIVTGDWERVGFGDEIDWEPRRLVFPGPWAGHLPFAFWLVKAVRPELLVELGTHTGNSYFAFCQAIDTLQTPTEAYAVDTWMGDEHAGLYGNEVFEDVSRHNQNFAAFSTLVRKTFDEARDYFQNRQIDILHIDGMHTYEAVRHDFETWKDRVSSRGVVLFHDTNVRERDFGVWKLWQELSPQHPSFEFLHSNGLGVLGLGSDLPEPVQAFFRLTADAAGAAAVRHRFSRRGETLFQRTEVIARERALADQRRAIEHLQEGLRGLEQQVHQNNETLARQADEFAERSRNLEKALRRQEGDAAEQVRSAEERARSAERSANERINQLETALKSARDNARRLSDEVMIAKAEAVRVHDTYRTSTSWRVTAPLRRSVSLLRGNGRGGAAAIAGPTPARSAEPAKEDEPGRTGLASAPDMKAFMRKLFSERLALFLQTGARMRLPSAEEPDVSIVLILYNQAELTFGCLASINECLAASDLSVEVILLDNGSKDETGRLLDRLDGATIIRSERNLHFLRGVNEAVDAARGRHVLLLNNDAQLIAGSLETAVRILDEDASVGAVGGRIILPDGTLQEAGSIIWSDATCVGYARGRQPDASEAMFRRDVDYCSGAFLLTPRALFERMGRLDEAYAPAYYEETDYCFRLREAGLRVVFDPNIVILHYEFGSSTKSNDALELQRRNHEIFRERHHHWLTHQPAPGGNPHEARSARSGAKRILFVDDRVPKPELGSGYPRANEIIVALDRQGARVTLFPMFHHTESWEGIRRCIPIGVEVVREGEASGLAHFLRERRGCFDAILVSRPHNMKVLREVLDRDPDLQGGAELLYDAEALFSQRDILRGEVLGEPLDERAARALVQEELALVRGSRAVLSVSGQERDLFARHGIDNVRLLGHAVEIDPTESAFGERADILFLGAVHSDISPNADSIVWFAREVLPLLRRELGQPDLRLKVVGMVDAPSVSGLDGIDVDLLGRVDDLRPAFEAARLVVIPTRFAAGIPHKAHHAASLGVPIVATELIRAQLGWRDGEDLLSAKDAAGFASACARLMRDETLWTTLRDNALERVREDCSPESFERGVAEVLALVPEPASARAGEGGYGAGLHVGRHPEHDFAAEVPFAIPEARSAAGTTVAAVVHLFYEEQAPSFRRYLENLPQGSDLFLSTDTAEKKARIEAAFEGFPRGEVTVRVTPNRGRDIAPKLVGFRDVYDRYEFVLHLHSKASRHDENLSIWRLYLLESLVGSPEIAGSCLWAMQREPRLGMIFPQHFDYVRRWVDWGLNLSISKELGERLGIRVRADRALDFPSGSMFWARSAALKPLLDLDLSFEDFPEESGQTDYTLAHAVERLYAMVCEKAGYRWMKIARRPVMADHTAVVALGSVPEFERFVRERTVSITGTDPIPVAQSPFHYNGETPDALRRAAGA